MLEGRSVLAVVPARSGSKGIPHKNLRPLLGVSLIGWAGLTLGRLPWLDASVLSTDAEKYAEEGRRFGLDAPFLRPPELSGDGAGALETLVHALGEAEQHYGRVFDIILIVEPTSPLRRPEDLEAAARLLIATAADSVVTVSPLPAKAHPKKLLTLREGRLDFFVPEGRGVVGRQMLDGSLYWKNGICYALTRACVIEMRTIFAARTMAYVIERPVVNIDDPLELDIAEMLMRKDAAWSRLAAGRD